jgi:hypothetical protein
MVRVVNVIFLQFVAWTLAGWIQRGQESAIDYFVERIECFGSNWGSNDCA